MKYCKYTILMLFVLLIDTAAIAQSEEGEKQKSVEETIILIEEQKEGDSSVIINLGKIRVKIGESNSISISSRVDEFEDEEDEGQTITIGKKNKEKKKVQTHFLTGFDLGFANFSPESNVPDRFEAMSKSTDVHWYLVSQRYNFSEVFSFQWGLDFNWRNYRFSEDLIFQKQANTGMYTTYLDSNISYSKNKLMARYISLPLMLEVHTRKTHSWKTMGVAFGASFGQLIGGKQKLISSENGKQKKRANYGFSPQRIDLIAKVTLGRITLYGNYGLTPMFRDADVDFSTEYRPYSVGLQLSGF